jgi:hypothetical protein
LEIVLEFYGVFGEREKGLDQLGMKGLGENDKRYILIKLEKRFYMILVINILKGKMKCFVRFEMNINISLFS